MEGLASVYCELLMAPFGEVLAALEEARLLSWADRSPHSSIVGHRGNRGNSSQGSLPNSHSQPIYVPGKYLVIFIIFSIIYNRLILLNFSISLLVVYRTKRRMKSTVSGMACLHPELVEM